MPVKFWHVILPLCIIAGITACQKTPVKQLPGSTILQGVWEQYNQQQPLFPLENKQYRIVFKCDSFYMQQVTHSKVNYYIQQCYSSQGYTEYVKGRYALHGDTLIMHGTYTHSNFKQKLTGCYHIGVYSQHFLLQPKGPAQLQLTNAYPRAMYSLQRVSATSCAAAGK